LVWHLLGMFVFNFEQQFWTYQLPFQWLMIKTHITGTFMWNALYISLCGDVTYHVISNTQRLRWYDCRYIWYKHFDYTADQSIGLSIYDFNQLWLTHAITLLLIKAHMYHRTRPTKICSYCTVHYYISEWLKMALIIIIIPLGSWFMQHHSVFEASNHTIIKTVMMIWTIPP
jgi:hypothetical protein